MKHAAILEQRNYPEFTTVADIKGYTRVAYKRARDSDWHWPIGACNVFTIKDLVAKGVLSFVHQRVGPGAYNLLCFRVPKV